MWPTVTIAGVHLSSYVLVHFVAIPAGGLLACRRLARLSRVGVTLTGLLAVIVAGILGAVALYRVVTALVPTSGEVPRQGSTILGALLAGGLIGLAYSRWQHLPLGRAFDLGIPGLPLGQAIGRLGCFAAGCCAGRPTATWLGLYLPGADGRWCDRFPAQLIASGADLLILATLLLVERRCASRSLSEKWEGPRAGGLPGAGKARGGTRCGASLPTSNAACTRQPPCALRVTGDVGPSAALSHLVDEPASPSALRLASGPTAPVTRAFRFLRQAPRRGLPFPGFLTVFYGLLYFSKRLLTELIREGGPPVLGPLTWAQVLALLGLAVALALLLVNLRRHRRLPFPVGPTPST